MCDLFHSMKMRSAVVYLFLFLYVLDEAWIGMTVQVHPPNCPNLTLKNGKVKKRQRGRFVKFICNPGFLLAGEKFATCHNQRRMWDVLPPKCVRPTCMNKINPPVNGLIYPTHNGAVAHIYCKSGYQIKGPNEIHCDGRKWDNHMPICLAANTKPKLFCDFEEADLCGWSHDLNHDFDWRRENYKTPSGSIGTGPSFDHTKGRGQDGYYMYIESSSRNINDTARLISPIFEKTDEEICLEFFYHMFGAATGTLRVYVKTISDSWDLDPNNAVFSKSGNQGDRWFRSYHSLGVIGDEYQIIIEGIRGNSYISDIAIDDVKIIQNCVYEEITTTTEMEYSTELLLAVESCENRCGHKANGNETLQIPCDCDDSCYDNNRCCPDYLDLCVSGTTTEDYLSTTDMANEIVVTTMKPVRASSTAPIAIPTTRRVVASPTTTRTTRTTTSTTTAKPTPKKTIKPTPRTTVTPKTAKKIITRPTRPTLYFLPRPTQPVIIKKILPFPIKPKIITPSPKEKETDVEDVPMKTNNDEELLLTSPLPERKTKENMPSKESEDRLDSLFMGNFSEKDKFLSLKASSDNTGYNVVLVVISVLGIAILTTVIVVILVRRFRSRHRRMASANGDSQSDVRFLTGDEVLDFSLDKDYDSL